MFEPYNGIVEVVLAGDDNGFFDHFAEIVMETPYARNMNVKKDQKNERKSIVISGNEFWVCQYFCSPTWVFYSSLEINLHVKMNGRNVRMNIVMSDGEIPDTDRYRVGSESLWVALGDFFCIPTTPGQRNKMANLVAQNSGRAFFYEEKYHDIRSYLFGRSATIQEVALMLSSDKYVPEF